MTGENAWFRQMQIEHGLIMAERACHEEIERAIEQEIATMTYVRPDIVGISPLATIQLPRPRDVQDRTEPVYGCVIHTTGSGIVNEAFDVGDDPFKHAVGRYADAKRQPYFAHYVIGFKGEIAQIADEHEKAQHVGWPQEARQAFLDGSWTRTLPPPFVAAWRARWPRYASPAHLFPGASVNQVTVGCELLPWQAGCDGVPSDVGLKYTRPQHHAVAALCQDIANRWGFPAGWSRTGRLCGHEDLNPLERTSGGKGYDPGITRPGGQPHIDWALIVGQLERPAVA